MKTHLDCIKCLVAHTLDAARMVTADEEVHQQAMKAVVIKLAALDYSSPPPVMGAEIHRIIRKITESPDPYSEVKRSTTEKALSILDRLRKLVEESENPFETAVRFAIAGNIIDFAADVTLTEEKILQQLERAPEEPVDTDSIERLRIKALESEKTLYVGDNAGEIVIDRLLIEQIPAGSVTFAVRGNPVINDATRDDALASGIDECAGIIDTGSDVPGVLIDECSDEFREHFESADLVISKGQGNYETLNNNPREIFFLLKAKCPVIARDIGCDIGSFQIFSNRDD